MKILGLLCAVCTGLCCGVDAKGLRANSAAVRRRWHWSNYIARRDAVVGRWPKRYWAAEGQGGFGPRRCRSLSTSMIGTAWGVLHFRLSAFYTKTAAICGTIPEGQGIYPEFCGQWAEMARSDFYWHRRLRGGWGWQFGWPVSDLLNRCRRSAVG